MVASTREYFRNRSQLITFRISHKADRTSQDHGISVVHLIDSLFMVILYRFANRKTLRVLFCHLLFASLAIQQAAAQTAVNAPALEKLFDPIFAERMEKLRIPGAVIAVVKDGKIVFTKGYGFADLEKKS